MISTSIVRIPGVSCQASFGVPETSCSASASAMSMDRPFVLTFLLNTILLLCINSAVPGPAGIKDQENADGAGSRMYCG